MVAPVRLASWLRSLWLLALLWPCAFLSLPAVGRAQEPQAEPGGPYSGIAGRPVDLDGSRSHAQGLVTFWEWDFGDGVVEHGPRPSHVWAKPGEYTVTLRVTDDADRPSPVATTTVSIRPGNRAPRADPGGPYYGRIGFAIPLAAWASSDPDFDVLTYTWQFGDGARATGVSPEHAYEQASPEGGFTVTLSVDDSVNSPTIATTRAIVIANQRPTADPGGPYTASTGEALAFDGSASMDADDDPITFRWTFGDGSTGNGRTPQHRYARAGTYTVTLTVNDGFEDSRRATTTVTAAP